MIEGQISLRDLVAGLKEAGKECTLLGVGPVSEVVVRATFEACANYKCPAIFIASRNQVDLESLGHGYLMGGMDQRAFVDLLDQVRTEVGYAGPVYICRDHGGPWQRNVELDDKYPIDKAMVIAKQSFAGDIEAGFNYLHIDPTKCPHAFSQDDIIEWTVELEQFCEDRRRELAAGPIDYEVGTEDIQGGLTTNDTFEQFIKKLVGQLDGHGLPLPTCVVGQTGTLCRIDHNVGNFDRKQTRELAAIANRYGIGFKEHNGDYLSAATCRLHPDLGVTGMNVAPEFGLVETDACLALADLEMKLVREGWISHESGSHLRELLLELTFGDSPWPKWMTDEVKKMPQEKIEGDQALRLLIGRVCGHYVYDTEQIRQAREALYANLNKYSLVEDAEMFVTCKVRDAIDFYFKHFRMAGINEFCSAKQDG